ncbi:MAG: sugar phosphate nucleotidyltransferase [Candidatus Pacebacteria bacterium]|nr:sugar phosphate nucleotidyltransferase [Candidatus Paceibacterota bacterium]
MQTQAIILAAGESSRFWPLNKSHKSQIKILGKPLVYWTIKSLSQRNIRDIIIIASPNNISDLKTELKTETKELGVNISFVVQEKPLGTGDAIFKARGLIRGPFFVFWPYQIIAGEIALNMLSLAGKEKNSYVFTGVETKTRDYGILKMEHDKLVGIVEKPKNGQEFSPFRVVGSYFLQPDFFEYFQKVKHHPEDFVDALNLSIKDKTPGLIILKKDVATLKFPWDILGLQKILLDSAEMKNYVDLSAKVRQNVTMGGLVSIGENTIVGENTVILGPCHIGPNCKIGANNVLRGPLDIEGEVVTGAFCELKNSLIQKGTHFHSGYFGDSVIGENCRFGAGFITANRRIDRGNINSIVKGKKIDTGLTYFGMVCGNNTRFGIHSGTMPGILIGSNCAIGPGSIVSENIEDGIKYFTEFKATKKKINAE